MYLFSTIIINTYWVLKMCQGLSWWLRQERICLQCGRPRFDPWVGKIPWRREWLPTPVFLTGESHGQRSLVGYSQWGHKESDSTEWLTRLLFAVCHVQWWVFLTEVQLIYNVVLVSGVQQNDSVILVSILNIHSIIYLVYVHSFSCPFHYDLFLCSSSVASMICYSILNIFSYAVQ